MNLFEELELRGLSYQYTNAEGLTELSKKEKIFVYAGVDPTGISLHLGHLIPLIVLCHFGKYGHVPIVLLGGGTARVGDPSGKTESRPLLSNKELNTNIEKISTQIRTIMTKFGIEPIFVNNNEWLNELKYIDFIRDIGKHFMVSRMLSFDTYKNRLESGLSFLEFNYQLLQAYDYQHLYKKYGCKLQIGGTDQWANIVAGNDLIRKLYQEETFGFTMPLITRSDGSKMGKTESGAVFIDPELTTPYDFYQYLRNTSDTDVISFLKQYTFLPLEEIASYEKLVGVELNKAKELLAYTLTEFIHGKETADNIAKTAKEVFYGSGSSDNMPNYQLNKTSQVYAIVDLYVASGLCASKSEARRLIEQGGAKLNQLKIDDVEYIIKDKDFINGEAILSSGKKKHMKIIQ